MGKSTRAGNPQQIAAMAKVCWYVLGGLSRSRAAYMAEIDPATVYRWQNPEVTIGPEYDRFRVALAHAETHFMWRELRVIQAAARIPNFKPGQVDWRASAWLMEHRVLAEYGAKATIEHTGPGGGPIQTEDKTLSDPQVRERLDSALAVL